MSKTEIETNLSESSPNPPVKAKTAAHYVKSILAESTYDYPVLTTIAKLCELFHWTKIPKKFKARLEELEIHVMTDGNNVIFFRPNCCNHLIVNPE